MASPRELFNMFRVHYDDEVTRNPHRCSLWLDYVGKLKSICPHRQHLSYLGYSKLYKIEIITQDNPQSSHITTEEGDLTYEEVFTQILNSYKRALSKMPLSYKLWYCFLRDLVLDIPGSYYEFPHLYSRANQAFESCLVQLYGTMAIYLLYASFLRLQNRITRVRRVYDLALINLPVTQHDIVWSEYADFVMEARLFPLGQAVFPRLIQLFPDRKESYYDFLRSIPQQEEEACRCLCGILNDDTFVSPKGKSQHQYWNELCELIRDHGAYFKNFPAEQVIRQGISKYTDQVSVLWVTLAGIYARGGNLDMARHIYQEAITSVATVEDFSIVFNCYAKFLEQLANAGKDFDLCIARLEYLVDNRALLLSSVRLKQNPHIVDHWIKRAAIFGQTDPVRAASVYAEAVQTVDYKIAKGHLSDLWIRFAGLYESQLDFAGIDKVFELAIVAKYRSVADLATVWCAWIETYLRHGDSERALQLSRRSTSTQSEEGVQRHLCFSLKLWSLALDMEENFGTISTCIACYDRMVELKVVSPLLVSKFCRFLQKQQHFESSFKAYEKGIGLFQWPHLYHLYLEYISSFCGRYPGTKLERAREIFQQAIGIRDIFDKAGGQSERQGMAPPEFARPLIYLYAAMEEEYGLARRAIALYRLAAKVSPPGERFVMYKLYICKTAELFGVMHTREIYSSAIQDGSLDDELVRQLSLQFIKLERGLGEIDRARAIFVYAAQLFEPSKFPLFWDQWKEFEILHGNQECFRDMLRLKASVSAQSNFSSFTAPLAPPT
ncbi:pre-mRNA-splicing factor SYF1 [Babesia microti strain RI]|uniref:Pre-mRNA-splicing factor SYF1 n=1 Tax=Babesia microti (strain RI) TaxID=1133968 RepID=I7JA07_BABMR|nr:pre-mRNA-splicing factor SYF1 [Babesia microti strain RI]CCF76133.1 pre-mRNA-splicing factor SYF1 [Babesia microti strain RI]|eukprot:XP_012650541.1 pre-mRNA-splicing factor SYF1 [Babesia microti strain RI]